MTRTLRGTLVTLGDPGQLTGGYLFHRRLAELAANNAARLEFVSFPRQPFPLALIDARRVAAMIGRTQPDVVVVDSIAAAFMAFVALPTPAVGMLHQPPGGIDHGALRSSVQAVLDRQAYSRLRRLLVASDSLADEMRSGGEPPERIAVVPPGRDVAVTRGKGPSDPRQGRRAAFLCVGNWVERKGILSLLEAFASLESELGTLHLVGNTAADKRYARRVWARLARPDLRGRVVVHGPLSVAEVASMYVASDAFVLPSLKEPYGTVYGEAMAFGLPVVGWRAGNLPYLADHEREGLLARPGDLGGLAAAMRRLALDEAMRRRIGDAARKRALSRPTWNEVAKLFFDHLREVSSSR